MEHDKGAQAGQALVTVTKESFLPLPAFVTPVTKVPNYCLFAALVDHVARGRSTPVPYLGFDSNALVPVKGQLKIPVPAKVTIDTSSNLQT